jgi:putative ABC transport system permease protein
MQALDPGFAERTALTFELGLPPARYETREAARRLHVELARRLAALPGVESVATLSPCLPLSGNLCSGSTLRVEGGPSRTGGVPPVTGVRIVTGDYFGAMGIRMRGRAPTDADAADGSPVAVLSEATAEAYFPGEDPVGRRVSLGGAREEDWLTVVGVAGNVKAELTSDGNQRLIYLPALSARSSLPPIHQTTYVLKASVPPESLAAAARDAVWALDDALPVARVRTLEGLIADAVGPASFALALVGLAAAVALVLGLVGVYAVLAYAVSRRTAEVGLRMALGAGAADVRWMVFRQGAAVVSGGLAAGLLGAFALTRTLRAVLFGVEPTDPATFLVVTLGLATAAAAALWLPARRAARVSPLEALRRG